MDKVLKVGQQSLLGYLPAIVIKNILDGEIDPNKSLPAYHSMKTVSLFADISGFTKLSEVFAKKGRIGPEFLAFSLNRYMEQLINIIGKNGGDIFKFAGDALLVVWPETKNTMEDTCRRAIQCAMDIQSKLNKVEMSPGKPLSVKIGLGVGECRVLFVGGQFKRCEYLIVGEAMKQACESETHATEGGQTIISQSVYDLVRKHYEVEEAKGDDSHGHDDGASESKFYMIKKLIGDRVAIKSDAFLMRTQFSSEKLREKLHILKTFVPAAISIYLDIEKESWSKEIRMLTVMFMNLKVDLSQTKNEDGMVRIQQIVHQVQRCVYRTKGSLNKFLMDDKGSVMLICWGLPPLSAHDDHVRSVLTALDLAKELKKFNCGAYFGIATGTCFTGVCGTVGGRREYSLLGEMVNLSARHMQKAIYYAKDLQQETKKKVDYLVLVCEKTRELIQNKISCDYVCQGELKGFSSIFYFYEPKLDLKPKIDSYSYFLPDIKTHRNNILTGQPNPKEKFTPDSMLKSALYMVGRKEFVDECLNYLYNVYKKGEREFLLIRGKTGSGKSLFLRKILYEFIESNKELKNKLNNKSPFIFISFQLPTTMYDSMNGWNKILKEIYSHLKQIVKEKTQAKFKIGTETVSINCDLLGEILLNSDCLSYVRYIEEILETSLSEHYQLPDDPMFKKFFQIKEIPNRDTFFESRKFNKNEKSICRFFVQMIKAYRVTLISDFPLIFIIEDAHLIDDVSIELMRALTAPSNQVDNKLPNGVCVITTYQDAINSIVNNQFDRFCKSDLFFTEKTFIMDNITEFSMAHDLIRYNIQGKTNVSQISQKLINIVLSKSMKGNPLFLIDIMNSLIDSGYVKSPNNELQPTDELIEMYEMNDWSNFAIPTRMERLLGNIIDNLNPKEIIVLKNASVIGNLFDIDKLDDLNPFNSVTYDDLINILSILEFHGIVEIMYDLNPKQTVYKFNIPFFREVLFQRMLIEQRSEIHLNIARNMQYNKFSYMPHKQEVAILRNHLKITEKTILKHMEDKDDDALIANKEDNGSGDSSLNINNLKIILVKDICERLKLIDLRMESEEIELSKRSLPIIKSGYLQKKSDKYISWEERYIVITNTKFFYWYHKEDYMNNKMPLGSFDLKSLYNVEILRDKIKGDKSNLFHIQVSNWYKKDLQKGSREYYFSAPGRDELYNWVITLNFLRVKAMYDEFSCNFGLINLPLTHEIKRKNKKKLKEKFHKSSAQKNAPSNNNIYTTMARKSVFTRKSEQCIKIDLRRVSVNIPMQVEVNNDDSDNADKVTKVKELLGNCFTYGFITFFGFIQEIVFGIDIVGMNDDRMISVPAHLEQFRNLIAQKQTFKTYEKEISLGSISNSKNFSVANNTGMIKSDVEEKLEEEDSERVQFGKNNKVLIKHEISLQNNNGTNIANGLISNPNENNISFQVNTNSNNKVSYSNDLTAGLNSNSATQNLTSDKQALKKQFTLQGQNSNPVVSNIPSSKDFENRIHDKLKKIDIDSNEDHLEELINSLSQGQNSQIEEDGNNDPKEIKNLKKKDENILGEINGKIHYSNVNSLIFNKHK